MKPNELRIGNYVDAMYYDYDDNEVWEQVIIAGLDSTDYTEWSWWFELGTQENYYGIRPIPLTEEWLVRFGFSGSEDDMRIVLPNGYGVELSIERDNTCLIRNYICDGNITDDFDYVYVNHCRYVHQLQNLYYSLTGKELEIQ